MKWSDIVPDGRGSASYFRGLADMEDPDEAEVDRYENAAIDLLANLLDCGDVGDALDLDLEIDEPQGEAIQKLHDAAIATLTEAIRDAPIDCDEYRAGRKDGVRHDDEPEGPPDPETGQ